MWSYPLSFDATKSIISSYNFYQPYSIRHAMFLNKHFKTLSVCWLALRIYSFVNYLFCTWFIFYCFLLLLIFFFLSICKSSFYSKAVDLSYVWWIFPSIIYYRICLWYILPWKYFSKYLCSYVYVFVVVVVCFYALFSAEIFVFVT